MPARRNWETAKLVEIGPMFDTPKTHPQRGDGFPRQASPGGAGPLSFMYAVRRVILFRDTTGEPVRKGSWGAKGNGETLWQGSSISCPYDFSSCWSRQAWSRHRPTPNYAVSSRSSITNLADGPRSNRTNNDNRSSRLDPAAATPYKSLIRIRGGAAVFGGHSAATLTAAFTSHRRSHTSNLVLGAPGRPSTLNRSSRSSLSSHRW